MLFDVLDSNHNRRTYYFIRQFYFKKERRGGRFNIYIDSLFCIKRDRSVVFYGLQGRNVVQVETKKPSKYEKNLI